MTDRIIFSEDIGGLEGATKLSKMSGAVSLNDEEMADVTGGFSETNKSLATAGYEIKCPKCGATDSKSFSGTAKVDRKTESVEYHCNCGCDFICYDGFAILKPKWVALCNTKNYTYPFA